jgi:siroheme synthase-like protein
MTVLPDLYPVCLVLESRRCLVVGGGAVARRKAEGLVSCGALVHVIAPSVLGGIREMPGVTWEERPYRPGDVAGYRLVIAASDDPQVNRSVFEEGEAAGIWVNAADQPDSCSFTLPAVARQGPVTVAVATGGRSPALASHLAARFRGEIGPEFAVLAELLSAARARMHAEGSSSEGADWRSVLDSDILELLRAGLNEQAEEVLRQCLWSS